MEKPGGPPGYQLPVPRWLGRSGQDELSGLDKHLRCYIGWSTRLSAKVNETDTFGPREDDEIQFDDVGDDDEDIDDI
ncbi:uncharacterized protein isoform X3 [Castor canadensis]|uniref:Uncharacterized protein isoform X3 n=5 Tax=Castor canadensis TaxID=51338 RepID=A0AC58LMX6_CASCN